MEKNIALYNEMCIAAERIFNDGINAPAGVYSLAQLAKVGTTCKTAPAGVYFREEYNADNLININVNGFECSYPARRAFAIAYKFERLAKVGAKARAAFQRAADHGAPVARFAVDNVLCDSLAACEDPRKGIRPQMQGVYIDLSAGLAACCDGYALNVSRLVDAQVLNADALNGGGLCLCRDFIKSAKGCEISIYKDGSRLFAVASNGASCDEITGRYPNYKSVFAYVDEFAPVQLVKSIRELKKTAAAVAKTAGCAIVCVSGYNGDDFITISAQGDGGEITRRVALSENLAATFATACEVARLKTINNNIYVFYIAKNGPLLFVGKKCISLLVTCYGGETTTATATAADSEKTYFACNYDVFSAFVATVEDVTKDSDNAEHVEPVEDVTEDSDNAEHVAPVEGVTEDSDNAEHVAPVEDVTEDSDNAEPVEPVEGVTEDSDNAEHVEPRRVLFDCLKVAAVLLLAFVLRTVSTSDSGAVSPSVSSCAAEHVEPVEGVTEDSAAEHVEPVEGVTEDSAAEHVEPVEPDNIEPGTTPAAPPLILIL